MKEAITGSTGTKPLKPSELIGIVDAAVRKQCEATHLVYVEGIYQQRAKKPSWGYFYDGLRDPEGTKEITLQLSESVRQTLTHGNLVTVGGLLAGKGYGNGQIQFRLEVTRVEGQQTWKNPCGIEEAKFSLLNEKRNQNRKNVDWFLEDLLYKDERPKVAIVIATGSITMSDIESTLTAGARASIDFVEIRTNLSNSKEFCANLAVVDNGHYHAVAIVRGGGDGIEKLDEIDVLRAVLAMKTPTISAVGHVEERLSFKQIVDKEVATPTALGHYFSELCDRVSEKKNQSKAVLVKQVAKQYEVRIAELEKKLDEKERKLGEQERATIEWASEKARLQENQKFHERNMEILQQRMNQERRAASDLLASKERDIGTMQKRLLEERGRIKGLGWSLAAMAGLVVALLLVFLAK